MSFFVVDVEADGPIPGDYSMVCFGAIWFDDERKFDKTFYGELKPISTQYLPEALEVSGFTRKETLEFEDPFKVMTEFKKWVLEMNKNSSKRPLFFADNNGFDYMFTHWYFEHFLGPKQDPFGWTSRNISDLYHGVEGNMWAKFKHLRKTKHTHNPIDDAKGNAEVLAILVDNLKLKV